MPGYGLSATTRWTSYCATSLRVSEATWKTRRYGNYAWIDLATLVDWAQNRARGRAIGVQEPQWQTDQLVGSSLRLREV